MNRILFDLHHNKILSDPLTRVMEIKTKVNKWDLIKLKVFAQQNKVKRQPSKWEKIIANETTDKELTCKIGK